MIFATIRHRQTRLGLRESKHEMPGETMESVAEGLYAWLAAEQIGTAEEWEIVTRGHHGQTGTVR